ncbi:hypothetical protein [Methylobacterium sp. J-067]|uniref:hypothetical protein n=1 Tax=Methylobacterium sp. J-067 TaxID=2836648 RepID=UPI001FBB2FAE|nr:hypothetical protein [Methylobacterium sp. J-067]MCJ2025751.1 hypothetical protein [Methylobacterium sp. J-067]
MWRCADPSLPEDQRKALVSQLMDARRAVAQAKRSGDAAAMKAARAAVDVAKVALGERGPVWWEDGSPDLNRHMARNTPYAGWYESVSDGER